MKYTTIDGQELQVSRGVEGICIEFGGVTIFMSIPDIEALLTYARLAPRS